MLSGAWKSQKSIGNLTDFEISYIILACVPNWAPPFDASIVGFRMDTSYNYDKVPPHTRYMYIEEAQTHIATLLHL